MLGFMYISTVVYHSVELTAEYMQLSHTYLFCEMFCGSKTSQPSSICHSLNLLWYTSKHSPIHSPTSHSLHWYSVSYSSCGTGRTIHHAAVNCQSLLKFTSSWLTFLYAPAGLARGRQGRGKLPATSIKFHTRASRKSLFVVLAAHYARRRKLFKIVMSKKWKKSSVHFHVCHWTEKLFIILSPLSVIPIFWLQSCTIWSLKAFPCLSQTLPSTGGGLCLFVTFIFPEHCCQVISFRN
jgi:hypothetical protein